MQTICIIPVSSTEQEPVVEPVVSVFDLEDLQQCITDVHTSDHLFGREEHDAWADPDKVSGLVAISPERNPLALLLSGVSTYFSQYTPSSAGRHAQDSVGCGCRCRSVDVRQRSHPISGGHAEHLACFRLARPCCRRLVVCHVHGKRGWVSSLFQRLYLTRSYDSDRRRGQNFAVTATCAS